MNQEYKKVLEEWKEKTDNVNVPDVLNFLETMQAKGYELVKIEHASLENGTKSIRPLHKPKRAVAKWLGVDYDKLQKARDMLYREVSVNKEFSGSDSRVEVYD